MTISEKIYHLKDYLEAESNEQQAILSKEGNLCNDANFNLDIDVWISRIGNDFCGNSPIGTLFDFRLMNNIPSATFIKEEIFKQKITVKNA